MNDKKNILLAGIVAALFFAILGAYWLHSRKAVPLQHPSKHETIAQIHVLQGNEFDVTLADGRRIHGRLAVSTTPEAKEKVITYINHSKGPEVVLLSQDTDGWIIELYFNGISLTEWLTTQKMVWK